MNEGTTIRPTSRAVDRTVRLEHIKEAKGQAEKVSLTARLVLREFDDYYIESRSLPARAQTAFEYRNPGTSFELSRRRLLIYSVSIDELGPKLDKTFPELARDEEIWQEVEAAFLPLIEGRYEADLAFAFMNSVRRKIYQNEWKPVAYAFRETPAEVAVPSNPIYRTFAGGDELSAATVAKILEIPGFRQAYRDAKGDALCVAERVNSDLGLNGAKDGAVRSIQMIDAGFYRNRGAYLLGRIFLTDGRTAPLAIALLNDDGGIYVDAVLTTEAAAHNIFSSTLANFHVTNPHYHELSAFLHEIMPKRPLGLHYSTIGFNHVGKVAVMNELKAELEHTNERLRTAVGFRGTVIIGFSAHSSDYVLKVIRDKPTAHYKWGEFDGVASVLRKYSRVHEINRTGSMLDNVIYYNLKLERSWFDPALLEEILNEAGGNVSLIGDDVVFKHLIVQRRMIPLPVFLETASEVEARTAVVNLGHCIKNNAAANVFNKDLDGRNYGVSRYLKVYLFDYDALEPFTEVKIRTNLDRIEGEEDIPDWFFEEGVIFLPEEIETGLRINDRALRRYFRERHGDLLTMEYWEGLQRKLLAGKVPTISTYPDSCRLARR